MKVIILAAGYATRLYPLTLTQPKPLLPVAGKPMVEHVLDNLAPITEIDRVYVVTNAKFAEHFQKWSDTYRATKSKFDFTVVNDHSTDDTNKLGAIGDINYVLKTQKVDDDLIIVAGDNLFSEKLGDFGKFCLREKCARRSRFMTWATSRRSKNTIPSPPTPRDASLSSRKSPRRPPARSPASRCIIIPKSTIPLIKQYIAEGNNPDQPGRLVQWLYPRTPVYTWRVPGLWFDIGSKETLEEANQIFAKF